MVKLSNPYVSKMRVIWTIPPSTKSQSTLEIPSDTSSPHKSLQPKDHTHTSQPPLPHYPPCHQTTPYHLPVAAGTSYVLDHPALYTDVPTTVTLFLSENVADVTTEFWIHVDHGAAVVSPFTGLSSTAVVSGQAPVQMVGPGMGYVVGQGLVRVEVLVSVEQ